MPVPFAGANEDDVPRPDETPLILSRDDALSVHDVENLVRCVHVRSSARPRLKKDCDEIQATSLFRLLDALHADSAAKVLRSVRGMRSFRLRTDDVHSFASLPRRRKPCEAYCRRTGLWLRQMPEEFLSGHKVLQLFFEEG